MEPGWKTVCDVPVSDVIKEHVVVGMMMMMTGVVMS